MIKSIKSFLARIAPYAIKGIAIVAGYFAAKGVEVVVFDAIGSVIALGEGTLVTTVVSAASFIVPGVLTAAAIIVGYAYTVTVYVKLRNYFSKKSEAPAVVSAPAVAA